MLFSRLFFAAAASLALAAPVLAQPAAPAAPTQAVPPASPGASGYRPIAPAGDILATLQSSGEFNTFIKAATATNLAQILKAQPNITVLAPTDAAFAALPPDQLASLMQPANLARLQKLVTYHLINARLDSSKIVGHAATSVQTVAGVAVMIDGSTQPIKANDAVIIQADVAASNGVIHVIDKVLSPDAAGQAPAAGSAGAGG